MTNQFPAKNLENNLVNNILNVFHQVNETLNYGNKTERKAAEWLINKYGLKKAIEVCEYSISLNEVPFAPSITSPYELKMKLAKLKIYQQRQKATPPPKKKLYYWGMEVREKQGKLWCVPNDGSAWMEFTGKESDLKTDPCG
jgi:hypothetical protein